LVLGAVRGLFEGVYYQHSNGEVCAVYSRARSIQGHGLIEEIRYTVVGHETKRKAIDTSMDSEPGNSELVPSPSKKQFPPCHRMRPYSFQPQNPSLHLKLNFYTTIQTVAVNFVHTNYLHIPR